MNPDYSSIVLIFISVYIVHLPSHSVSSYSHRDGRSNSLKKEKENSPGADKNVYSEQSDVQSESDDENMQLHGELGYILPEQTSFDNKEDLVTSKVLSTAPPKFTIMPSSVKETNCHTKNSILSKSTCVEMTKRYNDECLSETSTSDFLVSDALKPSTTFKDSAVAMSGRVETQSRTDSIEDVTPVRFLTHPSTTFALDS